MGRVVVSRRIRPELRILQWAYDVISKIAACMSEGDTRPANCYTDLYVASAIVWSAPK